MASAWLWRKTTYEGFLNSTTVTTRDTRSSSTALASNFGGATVSLNTSNDITIKGSNVVSDNGTILNAQGGVTIEAAQNSSTSSSFRQETSSGLMSGAGLSISYGSSMQSSDGKDTTTTAAASTVGSVNGGVIITAGKQYKQIGSDVVAPNGDISITAKTVDIQEARETNKQTTEQKFEQSGVTSAVTSTVLSTLENAKSQIKATTQTSDGRMKALGAASTAANMKMAADALKAGQGDENGMVKTGAEGADGSPEVAQGNAADKAGGIQVSLSYGQSSSQSNSSAQSNTARGSTVKSGGITSIKATGDGQNSNLTIQGSDVSGMQVNLEADNKVNLLAAQNTSSQTSSNSNSSASVGVAAQLGNQGGGMGVTGSASKGSGNGNGTQTTYTNTHIAGANRVSIKSGGDTTFKGAVVEGNQVTANIGGSLNIESLQDTATYAEKNQQIGASGMIGAGGSGSANYAKSSINSNYASVTEQSGIKAGDGGFSVNVQGNTDLKGGAITSTQAAIDNNKNTFSTGGKLTTSDIENSASYEAKSVSVSVGAGSSPMPGQGLSSTLSGVGMGQDSGNASSVTTAGISGIAGDTAKRTGDKSTGLTPIFNKEQVKAEITAQTQITQEFGKQASKAVGDYAKTQYDKAVANNDTAGIAAWSEGGASRVALHTVVGGLTGGVQGATGAATSQAAIDQIGQAVKNTDLPVELKQVLVAAAGTAVGAAASGGSVAGGAAAFNATTNNYLSATDLRNRDQRLADARKRGDVQAEVSILKEYEAKSAKNTGAIDYRNLANESVFQAEKTQLEQLVKDPSTSAETKAQAQRSINELNTAINVIRNTPQTPPIDYVTIQGGGVGVGVNASVNLLNGDVFVGGGKSNLAPGAGVSAVAGRMITDVPSNENRADAVSRMLDGGAVQTGACVAGGCIGVNQSLGPKGTNPPTAIEFGIGTPSISVGSGASVNVYKNESTSGK